MGAGLVVRDAPPTRARSAARVVGVRVGRRDVVLLVDEAVDEVGEELGDEVGEELGDEVGDEEGDAVAVDEGDEERVVLVDG